MCFKAHGSVCRRQGTKPFVQKEFMINPIQHPVHRSAWLHSGLAVTLLLVGSASHAQDLRVEREISLSLANEAAIAAVQACQKNGYTVSATVVGRAGQIKVVARGDGAAPHTPDTSRRKAYTSLTTRNSSAVVAENWQKNPALSNLVYVTDILAVGGAIPIRAGSEVVGAIGVSGSPSGQLDEQCAQLGLDLIKDRLK